jgi:lysophospholipase L1-like esterase
MKLRFLVTICALALVLSPTGAAAGASDAAPVYYLSLGDSLAAGTQPGREFTNEGYADQLAAALRAKMPTLRLVKLGCPGETTTSMSTPDLPFEGRTGHNACRYPQGSQLAEAINFLHAHQRFMALVTIDIGPNDILDPTRGSLATIQANLPVILAALRRAAGPTVPIVGMNFYDPRLAQSWLVDHPGDLGALSVEIANAVGFNNFIEALYAAAGDPVADVEEKFFTTDTTLIGTTPRDVVLICAWTWICGPERNIHANATGYGVIAVAFLAKL